MLRRQSALKRGANRIHKPHPDALERIGVSGNPKYGESAAERRVLARELADIAERVLRSSAGPHSIRDKLIFQLCFYHDLSLGQIVHCQGINLTKAGVDRVLTRLKNRIRALVEKGLSDAAA